MGVEASKVEALLARLKDAMQYGHPMFYEMLVEMAELHSRKNHDYAGDKDPLSNLRSCERLGLEPWMGVLVRLQDKWSRLENFVERRELKVKDESVVDTALDNSVYSLLFCILYKEAQREKAEAAAQPTSEG